jgi:hypothetical protein
MKYNSFPFLDKEELGQVIIINPLPFKGGARGGCE